ncbi:MAG: hypothetical protein ACR2QS_09405 [Woeseiaceae bacterium]
MKHRSVKKQGFQHSTLIAGVVFLLIFFICGGFFYFLYQPGLSADQETALAELRDRRAEWEAERPPAFRYEVERACDCPLDYIEPFDVVEYLDDPVNRAWIDEFFVLIEAAMLDGKDVPVSFDPRFGFPNDFTIDAEDTFIRDFEVLEYADQSQ